MCNIIRVLYACLFSLLHNFLSQDTKFTIISVLALKFRHRYLMIKNLSHHKYFENNFRPSYFSLYYQMYLTPRCHTKWSPGILGITFLLVIIVFLLLGSPWQATAKSQKPSPSLYQNIPNGVSRHC